MKSILQSFTIFTCLFSTIGRAEETLTIRTEDGSTLEQEQQRADNKEFCSKKSEEDAAQKCQSWLTQQQRSLGERLLTSFCSEGEISSKEACLYRSKGEIKYLLKVVRKQGK